MTAPALPLAAGRKDTARRFARNRLGVTGLIIVLVLIAVAVGAPWIAPHHPDRQNLLDRRTPPGDQFALGADEFGRDILSRLIHGARVTLLISGASVALGLLLGTALGVVAGYAGGAVDDLIMRFMDLLLAFPYLLLAIVIVSALGPGIPNTILAIGIWSTPAFARLARGSVNALRGRDFVQAAHALGARGARVVLVHILPNFIAPVIVYATLYLANAVLMESALSFLGLGVQPPTASWAGMIASGRNYITSAPHIATIPGLAIALAVLGFNLLGDGLRDALDPRLK